MVNICIPCSSVQRLLDSGQFQEGLGTGEIPGVEPCDSGKSNTGQQPIAQSLHKTDLRFVCAF